ncbi:MAG: 50S ribosomal protein L23 [Candidatus Taylorbacteria bacterium RIFCSPHIGHO2_01_FULL_46_22b]|uniref:Large ribosomal subunit protein uL23 n=1 Tax=Candidatus Taylorbacteria bacterium RIFCSPHIGHO2_01_FULL_46_22b TaxID=1802301 RepID=A0A1G2M379_9BACT|nr:MAG: 50S ribosomal protein L23 [Candidatus Taylorbacteria bacterium RIFCSPHIGHO2_01_FULL_46_22b]
MTATGVADRGRILQNPRVTEKVTFLAEKDNVYTFNVTADATKQTVSELITRLYKVHPTKVHILPVPSKRVFVRGKRGVKRGGRKAYVFLKKGEKIELV